MKRNLDYEIWFFLLLGILLLIIGGYGILSPDFSALGVVGVILFGLIFLLCAIALVFTLGRGIPAPFNHLRTGVVYWVEPEPTDCFVVVDKGNTPLLVKNPGGIIPPKFVLDQNETVIAVVQ